MKRAATEATSDQEPTQERSSSNTYDLIIQDVGDDDGSTSYHLIPVELVTGETKEKFEFAQKVRHPESPLLFCVDQVVFPEDSDEIIKQKRKRGLTLTEKKPNQQFKYVKTKDESSKNWESLVAVDDLLKTPAYKKYKLRNSRQIENVTIRRTYHWQIYE